MILVGTEFSGAGTVDHALKGCGARLVFAVEFWEKMASEMYIPNHGDEHLLLSKVQDVCVENFKISKGNLDIYWASPECDEFSKGKKGLEGVEQTSSAFAIANHIKFLMPKCVVVENVEGYVGSRSYNYLKLELRKLFYSTETFLLNSADYGTPQTRKRMFLIATRKDIGSVPAIAPTHAKYPMPVLFGNPIKPWKGWLEAVADLLPYRPYYTWNSKQSDWTFHQANGQRMTNGLANWQRNRLKEAIALGKLKEFNSLIVDGKNAGREITICDEQKPAYTIVGSSNSESHWPTAILVPGANAGNNSPTIRLGDKPTVTITPGAHPTGVLSGNRIKLNPLESPEAQLQVLLDKCIFVKFSTRMLARLQGLGDDYKLCSNNALASEGIGNGVAVEVAEAIFKALEGQINRSSNGVHRHAC